MWIFKISAEPIRRERVKSIGDQHKLVEYTFRVRGEASVHEDAYPEKELPISDVPALETSAESRVVDRDERPRKRRAPRAPDDQY
jgi:hypothetical protein